MKNTTHFSSSFVSSFKLYIPWNSVSMCLYAPTNNVRYWKRTQDVRNAFWVLIILRRDTMVHHTVQFLRIIENCQKRRKHIRWHLNRTNKNKCERRFDYLCTRTVQTRRKRRYIYVDKAPENYQKDCEIKSQTETKLHELMLIKAHGLVLTMWKMTHS